MNLSNSTSTQGTASPWDSGPWAFPLWDLSRGKKGEGKTEGSGQKSQNPKNRWCGAWQYHLPPFQQVAIKLTLVLFTRSWNWLKLIIRTRNPLLQDLIEFLLWERVGKKNLMSPSEEGPTSSLASSFNAFKKRIKDARYFFLQTHSVCCSVSLMAWKEENRNY